MIDVAVIGQFLAKLADPSGVFDFRALHDADRGAKGIPLRGTLEQVAGSLDFYNTNGYGIFVVINETDGAGAERANVTRIRAQFTDSDDDPSYAVYHAMRAWELPPTFSVITSAGKHHDYWIVEPYEGVDRFELIQQKLISLWHSDPPVWDAPRVMRLPGTAHMKNPAAPIMVGLVEGSGTRYNIGALEWALQNIAASGSAGIERRELGEAGAPSFELATYALAKIDPVSLDRIDWLKLTASFKTATYAFGEDRARNVWDQWCAQYPDNDLAENDKIWNSIRDTKVTWSHLETVSGVKLERMFGRELPGIPATAAPVQSMPSVSAPEPQPAAATPEPTDASAPGVGGSDFLLPGEQAGYFKGCTYIGSMGRILTPGGRFMDATKFNGWYGGKNFVLDNSGKKVTDEPWRAATRGQVWQVPKVDHIRFLPTKAPGEIIYDELGRSSVNTYIPARVHSEPGDITPFLVHLAKIIPEERDRQIIINYLRHQVQRPGRKIFWTILIQSSEGAGKGIFKYLMTYALGGVYVHAPNTKELTEGGGKFTGWMNAKLMIIADEIRVDDKRDMIEVLKPWITEARIEMQSKGVDQEMGDNVANWLMFSNYKDAIPITANDRRYAIFYSAIQSVGDLTRLGMDGTYFPLLYAWLYDKGAAYVTHWLKTTPIDPEFDPIGLAHRAPVTSSLNEALVMSRGKVETIIADAIDAALPGFRGGYVSSARVQQILKGENMTVSHPVLGRALSTLGYVSIGRANAAYFQEEMKQPNIWARDPSAKIADYAAAQGYR